jgi:hypothetical protein
MPPSRKSTADQSAKLTLELLPLYAGAIPERSRKRLAKNPPDGPLLLEGVNRHIDTLSAAADTDPLVFYSAIQGRRDSSFVADANSA